MERKIRRLKVQKVQFSKIVLCRLAIKITGIKYMAIKTYYVIKYVASHLDLIPLFLRMFEHSNRTRVRNSIILIRNQ